MKEATAKTFTIGGVLLLSTLALGGCATKNFVRDSVAVVDTRVTTVDGRVSTVDNRVTEVDKTAREALDRATAAGKLAEGKFNYSVVLSDDAVKFPVNASQLSPEAEARLAELVTRLKGDNKNVYLEIQGHTDASGPTSYNEHLGELRADAVRKYLSKQGVALSRIATISYGEAEPVAPNNNRDGRAQNRRVVIVVLS